MVRRFPSLRPCVSDRGEIRILPRFRGNRRHREGNPRRVRLRWQVLEISREDPWSAIRGSLGKEASGVPAEPRPGGEQGGWSKAEHPPDDSRSEGRGGPPDTCPEHSSPVHGGRVWRNSPVLLFH